MTRLRSCRQYHKEKGRKHSVPFYVDKLGRLRYNKIGKRIKNNKNYKKC